MSNEKTENLFRKNLPKDIWVKKIKVIHQQEPFDYIVLGKNLNRAFEIKECKRGRFSFKQDIKPHQYAGLTNFRNIGVKFQAYIFIHIMDGQISRFFNIPIFYMNRYREHKSVNIAEFGRIFWAFEVYEEEGKIKLFDVW